MGLRIYVAGPLATARSLRTVADGLERAGHRVVSSWHDHQAAEDPRHHLERWGVLKINVDELEQAEAMLVWTPEGTHPRATFGEIGWAIARGLPVLWGPERKVTCLWDAHPLVRPVIGLEAVGRAVEALAAERRASAPLDVAVGWTP